MNKLEFAQKFPFTNKSKEVLKEMGAGLEDIDENAMRRAALMVLKANSKENYSPGLTSDNHELLEKEVMAFPLAKMLISAMTVPNLSEKFATLISKKTFEYIVENEDGKELALELADDLEINYEISEIEFVNIKLIEYLDIYFTDEETKLVNKIVNKGNVILNLNDFSRFLSEKAYKKVIDSMPIEKKKIPKTITKLSKSIESQLGTISQKKFDDKIVGKVDPKIFPPSIKKIYDEGLAGRKLNHYERLTIAGFLRQVGMSEDQVINFFSKAPNYKKQLTEYHVKRIFESELSAPGFNKMNEYGIITIAKENKFKHPIAYYKAQLRIKNRMKNKKKESEENAGK
jgi:DNA primase large subunit